MKTIKFRAFNKDNNLMMKYHQFGEVVNPVKDTDISIKLAYRDTIILMQFTGKEDKNGKEIYEGDIVSDGQDTGYIEYMSETTEYIIDYWKKGEKESRGESLSSIGEVEVIGDIYTTPELLTK